MRQIPSNAIRVKEINTELVRTVLKAAPYGTKVSIAQATGLSVATCGNILADLIGTGEAIETEPAPSSGGRPARRFVYNPDCATIALVIAMAGGGPADTLRLAVANMGGKVIEEETRIIPRIDEEAITGALDELTARYGNVRAIGIGVPGIVRSGRIGICDIPALSGLDLGAGLRERYRQEVTVENDMNLTVLGFYRKQARETETTVAYLSYPRGNFPGTGIIVNGTLVRGATNFAGEVSFLPYGISRAEQLVRLGTEEGLIPLVVKAIASIAAVINPETVALSGVLLRKELVGPIRTLCCSYIPEEHLPAIVLEDDTEADYRAGLVSLTLESLACSTKLVRSN